MRGRSSVLLGLAATAAVALGLGSCTSTTGPSFPAGAVVIPATFTPLSVGGLPTECSGQVYYEASTSLCPPGITYLLCDGVDYTEYDCTKPGSGWSEETFSQYDRVGSDPTTCTGGAGAGGPSGTAYVLASETGGSQNAVLVFDYCDGMLASALVGRYLTGGSGGADLNDTGVLDADQQLALNADSTLLYAVNQGSDTIGAFHVGAGGSLTPVTGSPFSSGGVAPTSLAVNGNILVVANKAFDGVRNLSTVAANYTTFSIGSDGALTPTGSTITVGAGAAPTQVYVPPPGNLVFATEETGVFRVFSLSSTGQLAQAAGSPLGLASSLFLDGRPDPVWPAGLSASPTQSILYTGIPNAGTIASYSYTTDGALTLIAGEDDPNAYLPCWSVVNSDGSRLYFANAGSDNISIWDTGTDPKVPTLLQTFELPGGGNPWGLRIDPTGTLLFVITPRQIHQVPESQGQLLHALTIQTDGTLGDEIDGSPATLPIPPDTNAVGVVLVGGQ